MNEKVDLFIVTYNRSRYLKDAIQSVLTQTYTNFVLYILDNCSTDNTESVVREFNDPRIHYIRHEQNIGGIGNIVWAFQHATSEYFVVFHDDDLMKPFCIERELDIMRNHPEYSVLSCLVDSIDSEGNALSKTKENKNNILEFKEKELFAAYIEKRQFVMFPPAIYRNTFIKENGIQFKSEAGPSCDILLFFDIERAGGTVAILEEALINYREHTGQDSVNNRAAMVEKLFQYLWNDDYYKDLLESRRKGRNWHYRRIMLNEFCLATDQKISVKEMCSDEKRLRGALRAGIFTSCMIQLVSFAISRFPRIARGGYLFLKKLKRRVKA